MTTFFFSILVLIHISGVFSSAANAPDVPPFTDIDPGPLIRPQGAAELLVDDVRRIAEKAPIIQEGLKDILLESPLTNIGKTLFQKEVLEAAVSYNVSAQCMNDTEQMINDLLGGKHYALQMLDSFGKLPSGLLSGHIQWDGAYEQCNNITSDTGDFNGKYCSAGVGGLVRMYGTSDIYYCFLLGAFPRTAPFGVLQRMTINFRFSWSNGGNGFDLELAPGQKLSLTLGTCFPSSCSGVDAVGLLNAVLSLTANKTTGVQKIHADYAVCTEPIVLDNGAIVTLVIIGILLFFVAVGTLYDIVVRCQESLRDEYIGEVVEEEKTPLLDGSVKIQTPREKGTTAKILLSFSAITNGGKILTVGNTKKDIGCLHGIRVLSMWWVILGHAYAFSVYNLDNLLDMASVLQRFSFQAIGNATFSVDTFFFLSGLLVTYLILKEMRAKDGKVNWAMLYFHRFWRLTPAYMFVLMFYTTLSKYINVGPLGLLANTVQNPCVDYWWTNLLYINNFYPVSGQAGCMAWGWYLANDMQFFIITPILVLILYKNRFAGLAVIFALILACFIATGVVSSSYELSVNAAGVPPNKNRIAGLTVIFALILGSFIVTGVISKVYELSVFDVGLPPNNVNTTSGFDQIYTKPYTRISTYAVGIFAGYILYLTDCQKMFKGAKFRLYALVGWCCAGAICLSVLYGCYAYVHDQQKMDVDLSAFYNSVSRFAWSVGVMIVVLACVHGHGGPVDAFLSWSAWIPLSRLTYCAYLVHPVVIFIFVFGLKQPMHYDDISMVYLFIGHLVISYAWAFLTSLVIEAPMMGLEKVIFRR